MSASTGGAIRYNANKMSDHRDDTNFDRSTSMRKRMHPKDRRYIRLPVDELFDHDGRTVLGRRLRWLEAEEMPGLLRERPLQFVVIDFNGEYAWKPRWIELSDCFRYWKTHVKARLCPPCIATDGLMAFPEGYCYRISEWEIEGRDHRVVLLEPVS